jgi:hypothetical protein
MIPMTPPVRMSSDSLPIAATTMLASADSPETNAAADTEVIHSPAGFETTHSPEAGYRTERHRHLAVAIRQRIELRLGGRVRELAIRVHGNTIVLEGTCATFYTKQLAQHAALGVLEDEHLENAIVVTM